MTPQAGTMYATTAVSPEAGTMYLTTSSGYPYVYHNGVAYFHTSEVSPVQQPWPVRNLFWYLCSPMDQDNCSVFKSLLLQFLQLCLMLDI